MTVGSSDDKLELQYFAALLAGNQAERSCNGLNRQICCQAAESLCTVFSLTFYEYTFFDINEKTKESIMFLTNIQPDVI